MPYGDGIRELGSILDRHNLIFSGEEQLQEFINLIMLAKNNTRIWKNNGYTPSFISSVPIGFAEGAKAVFREMHEKAIKHGIITSLE